MKLAAKLLAPILTAVTIGLIAVTMITYKMSSNSLEKSTADLQKMAIANALKELESGLHFNVLNAISLSQTGLLQPFLSGDASLAQENFAGAQARVKNMKNTYSYEMLGILTAEGAVVAHTDDPMLNKNLANEQFFKDAKTTGKVSIGDPFLYNGEVSYIVAAPVFSPDRKLLGVVFNASKMTDTMSERMHLGHKGYVMVTDKRGLVFIHKDKSAVLKKNIGTEAWGKVMLGNARGKIDFAYGGAEMTAYYDTLPGAEWVVAAVADDEEILMPVTAIRNNSAMIAVAILLVVAGVIYWIVRSILASLKVGTNFAQLVSDGNFAARWNTSSSDEIGELAHKLNTAFEKVADQAQWYVSILDSIPILISVSDMAMKWTFVNEAVLSDVGGTRESLIGRSCTGWGAGTSGNARVGIAGLNSGISRSEFTANGKTFDVTAAYLTDRNGKNVGHVEVLQDASEQASLKQEAAAAARRGQLEAAARLEQVVSIVSQASGQLSAKIGQADNGARQVADRMHETSRSMHDMSATVDEVKNNAAEASAVADNTRAKAQEGARIVGQMIASIGEVQTQAQNLKSDMVVMGKQAESIGEILTVISDIADQTNLLALNAAIEAARAGDMGRGFAVVADEIRKLAGKTMQATTEVGSAIRAVQQSARANMSNVDQAVSTIVAATEQGLHSGNALKEIVVMSEGTTDKVHIIARAAEGQAASASAINESVDRVNNIAGDVSTAMHDATKATEELARQTSVLNGLINEMKNS